MKNYLMIIAATMSLATQTFAQEKKKPEVPEVVKKAFATMAPSATKAKWEMEDGNYEAEYKENGKETSMVFSPAGKHLMTEHEIAISELPSNVAVDLARRAPGKKIEEASKLDYADGTIMYEAECGDVDYIFDAQGKYSKTEEEEKGDEDDDDDKKEKH